VHCLTAILDKEVFGVSYREILEASMLNAEKFGYRYTVVPLEDAGLTKLDMLTNSWKPEVIRWGLEDTEEDEILCWLDADTYLLRPFDDFGDFDVALTKGFRRIEYRSFYYLNAGVIFARPTPAAKHFFHKWMRQQARKYHKNDEGNLKIIIDRYCESIDDIEELMVEETLVKILPATTYNAHLDDASERDGSIPYIKHFVGDEKKKFRTFIHLLTGKGEDNVQEMVI